MNRLSDSVLEAIEQASSNHSRPRLDPSGFIHLNLTDGALRIWPESDPELRRPEPFLPVHAPNVTYEATVLAGSLTLTMFGIEHTAGGSYHIYEVYPYGLTGDRNRFGLEDRRKYSAVMRLSTTFGIGDGFGFEANHFHEIKTEGLTAAVIKYPKDAPRPTSWPRVLCPQGTKPDSSFNGTPPPQEKLWGIIDKLKTKLEQEPIDLPPPTHPANIK